MKSLCFARRIIFLALFALVASGAAHAEIEKQNLACEKGPCVKWWPKAKPPSSWLAEPEESREHGVSMFALERGTTDMRMYTYAIRKSDKPDLHNLDDLIALDKKSHGEGRAMEGKKLFIRDGTALRTFLFASKGDDRWDQAAYGEDDTFFIVFYITSNGLYELNKHTYDFESFVGSYAGNPKPQEPPKPHTKEKPKALDKSKP